MARNRTTVDREEKRAEIVDAATKLFTQDGYEATSIGTLAKAAGITTNTIYWYFDDKDAVLVAVLQRLMKASLDEYLEQPPPTLTDRLLWLVGVMDQLGPMIATVHTRAQTSEAIGAWHDDFHATGDAWLLVEIRAHLAARGARVPSDAELAAIPRLWSYAIEGMVAHDLAPAERRELCAVLVRQLDAL